MLTKKNLPLILVAGAVLLLVGIALLFSLPSSETPVEEKDLDDSHMNEEMTDLSFADGEYSLVAEDTTLNWHGAKIGTDHFGSVDVITGDVVIDGKESVSGGFVIDMNSITDTDLEGASKEKLESHLKSSDFFDVEKFPEAIFDLTGYSEGYLVGDLTIKNKTNEVKIPVSSLEENEGVVTVEAMFNIDRSKWDIKYGSGKFFEGLGDKLIEDDIELTLNLVLEKK